MLLCEKLRRIKYSIVERVFLIFSVYCALLSIIYYMKGHLLSAGAPVICFGFVLLCLFRRPVDRIKENGLRGIFIEFMFGGGVSRHFFLQASQFMNHMIFTN